MKIMNRKNIKPIIDACETLQEMYASKNISIAYSTITEDAKPHKHVKTEEIYYIVKGKASIRIGNKIHSIREGDTIPIPKKTYHNIEKVIQPIELVAVCYPRFNKKDMVY